MSHLELVIKLLTIATGACQLLLHTEKVGNLLKKWTRKQPRRKNKKNRRS
ncbi:hypothetical protein L2089_15855 [Paenibacillus hunanensis]|nr:hypothetical protein [Paenibacillus hunanensis]MCL9662169.1 hypothetical protein [Paenibacillus hunanensis]